MAFDYKKALEAEATEDQVIQYLNQTRNYNTEAAIQAGASKGQIIEYLSTTQKPQPVAPAIKKPNLLEKAVTGIGKFLTPPVEFAERSGTTIGESPVGKALIGASPLGQFFRTIKPALPSIPQEVKTAFEAPSAISPGGAKAFKTPKEAIVSGLKAAEVLTTPAFGAGKTFLARTAITAGLGALAGTTRGLEEESTNIAKEIGKGVLTSQIARAVVAPILLLRNLGLANEQLTAIQKAFGGKKVIDLSKAAKEVDAFITQARAAKTLEGNAAAKKLAQYKQLLERSAKLSLKGGLETKRALQRSAARYYDKEIVPAMKAAQKAVARNLRLQTEKAAPEIVPIMRRLSGAKGAGDLARFIVGKVPFASVSGLRNRAGEIVEFALSNALRKTAGKVPQVIPTIVQKGIAEKSLEAISPEE